MKKCNLMLFLLSSILLVGCATSDTNVEQKKDDDIVEILESQVETIEGETNETDTLVEERENPLIEDVISAYAETIEHIEPYTPNEASYGLIYVDENDIPELFFIDNSSHLCGANIYNYVNEKVNELVIAGSNGSFIFKPHSSLIVGKWSGFSVDQYSYYKIVDNTAEKIRSYECPIDGMNPKDYPYMINDKEVSEEEYKADYAKLKGELPDGRAGVAVVNINDGFLWSEFNKNDFITNYKNYIIEPAKTDPLSGIDYFNTSFCEIGEPAWIELEEKFMEQTNSKPEDILLFTYKGDKGGALVFTGKELDDEMGPAYEGKLWYIGPDSKAEVIFESQNGYSKIDGNIEEYYYLTEYYTTGGLSYVFGVKDGKPYEVEEFSGIGQIVGYYNFDPYIKVEVSEYDNIRDKDGNLIGHTWKPYYFGTKMNGDDYELFEFEGHEISEEELVELCGFDIVSDIKEAGYKVGDIYNRDNGIVSVNVEKELEGGDVEYNNVNYDIENKCYVCADDEAGANSMEGSMFGGIYKNKILK